MQVEVIGNDGQRVSASVEVRHLSSSEKSMDSLKKFAIFFGLAICALPIPFAHFVLVPGLLCAGVFFAVRSYLTRGSVIETANINCPNCGKEQKIVGKNAVFPMKETCEGCRRQSKVQMV